jgi:hypothetical protein
VGCEMKERYGSLWFVETKMAGKSLGLGSGQTWRL